MDNQVKDNQDAVTDESQDQKNDPSDKLTPEHPRFKEVLEKNRLLSETNKQLEDRIAKIEEQVKTRADSTGEYELTDEEKRALDKIDKALKERGYVKKEELDSAARIEKQALEFERLSEKYDGANGLPKFIADDVAAYAKQNGFSSLEKAYRDMHWEAFVSVEVKKRSSGANPPHIEKPTGGERQIQGSTYTRDQISQMSPDEWEKNREKILRSLKG